MSGMLACLKAKARKLLSLRQQLKKSEDWRLSKKVPANKILIEAHKFYCQKVAMDIEFLVPTLRAIYPAMVSDSTILEAHMKYRYASEPWLVENTKTSEKKFAMELESVYMTFPRITDRSTILAMAAWLSVLCTVDDVTEKMEPNAAKKALQDARNIIAKDTGIILSADIDWSQELTPEDVIRHAIREFSVYTHHLLPPITYDIFLEDINEVFSCMMTETVFRETPPPSVDAYMKIRRGTIAISPFFTLVDGFLNKKPAKLPPSTELIELKELLSEIVGLQNDLIGVDKDTQNGWSMNVILVLGGLRLRRPDSPKEEAQVMKECVREAENMHNNALRKAIACWEVIQNGSKTECEKELSDVMIEFIGRFLEWSMASQRYKSG